MSLEDFGVPPAIPAPPPKYTPPPPPSARPEDVEHDYTPVNITDGGEVQVGQQQQRQEEEVWGALPLKSSPQPKPRASPQRILQRRSPSAPHIHALGSSPLGRPLVMPPEPSSPPPFSPGQHWQTHSPNLSPAPWRRRRRRSHRGDGQPTCRAAKTSTEKEKRVVQTLLRLGGWQVAKLSTQSPGSCSGQYTSSCCHGNDTIRSVTTGERIL